MQKTYLLISHNYTDFSLLQLLQRGRVYLGKLIKPNLFCDSEG